MDGVMVASSYPGLCQIAGRPELAEDFYCGARGDPDQVGDVADPQLRVAGEAREHEEVVGQKRPLRLVASSVSIHVRGFLRHNSCIHFRVLYLHKVPVKNVKGSGGGWREMPSERRVARRTARRTASR